MKRVFISHPYANNPEENKRKVDEICKAIVEEDKGILPISPLHLWGFLDNDDDYRDEIMAICYRLIEQCDEVWVYGDSAGCRLEQNHAKKMGIPVRYKAHCCNSIFNSCDRSCRGSMNDCLLKNYQSGGTIPKPTRKEMLRYFEGGMQYKK